MFLRLDIAIPANFFFLPAGAFRDERVGNPATRATLYDTPLFSGRRVVQFDTWPLLQRVRWRVNGGRVPNEHDACSFVGTRFVMLGCLPMMSSRMFVMFGSFLMMLRAIVLGHLLSPASKLRGYDSATTYIGRFQRYYGRIKRRGLAPLALRVRYTTNASPCCCPPAVLEALLEKQAT